jgi:hypothetical protein
MIFSKQIKKSTLLFILVLVSVSLTAIPGSGPMLVSAAKGKNAIRSRTSAVKRSVRSVVNKRSLQKETETRCKFLKPSGKKATKPLKNTGALAAPDVQFQEQSAERVLFQFHAKIVPPASKDPPPPGKGKDTPPPPGFEWDYPDGKDPKVVYEFCETPSPRLSAKPSPSPSSSISHHTTISMPQEPSVSAEPTNSPSPRPSAKPSPSPSSSISYQTTISMPQEPKQKEIRCKFLVPSGKNTTKPEKVFIDAKIAEPAAKDPPPPGKGKGKDARSPPRLNPEKVFIDAKIAEPAATDPPPSRKGKGKDARSPPGLKPEKEFIDAKIAEPAATNPPPPRKGKGKEAPPPPRLKPEKEFIDAKIAEPAATNPPPPGKGKEAPPPPGFKWYYPDGKDPNVVYELCEPSRRPTNQPSPSPSITSSISLQTTISMPQEPSVSAKPTNSPSYHLSPGCKSSENGGDKDEMTNTTVRFDPVEGKGRNDPDFGVYEYQLVYFDSEIDGAMMTILTDIDDTLQAILEDKLIWCGQTSTRRRLVEAADLHDIVIDRIDIIGIDTLVREKKCPESTVIPSGYKCAVYKGNFTVWGRSSANATQMELNSKVLLEVMQQMKGFTEDGVRQKYLANKIDHVHDIKYGGTVQATDNLNNGTIVTGANEDPTKVGGVAAIASGLAFVAFLFAFAAVRKREHHKLSAVEEDVEDNQSLFGKMSNGSNHWRNQRDAHVLGEEDSVDSVDFDSDDIVADIRVAESSSRLYGMGISRQLGLQEDNLGGKGDALNVHTCTSATCPICNGTQSPTFVDTHTGTNILSPIEEVSASTREEGTPANVQRPITQLITPSYSDTVVDMTERNYQSSDTVEF